MVEALELAEALFALFVVGGGHAGVGKDDGGAGEVDWFRRQGWRGKWVRGGVGWAKGEAWMSVGCCLGGELRHDK